MNSPFPVISITDLSTPGLFVAHPSYARILGQGFNATSSCNYCQLWQTKWKATLLFHPGRSLPLDQARTAFGIEPAHTTRRSGTRWPARFHDTLPLLQSFGHALE